MAMERGGHQTRQSGTLVTWTGPSSLGGIPKADVAPGSTASMGGTRQGRVQPTAVVRWPTARVLSWWVPCACQDEPRGPEWTPKVPVRPSSLGLRCKWKRGGWRSQKAASS